MQTEILLPVRPSAPLTFGFVALVFVVAALVVLAYRRAATEDRPRPPSGSGLMFRMLMFAYLAATAAPALMGVLRDFGPPPKLFFELAVTTAVTVAFALSPVGKRIAFGLPIWVLVGFHAFRILVELAIHRAHTEGLAPEIITWSGRNFDIVTGVAAVPMAALAAKGRAPKALLWAFNGVGLGLLVNVVAVSILSAPTPFQRFETDPPLVWVVFFPWVWLPTVLVMAALLGHLVLTRRLLGR